jgi:glycerol-3-phosphate dehydrogenase
MTKVDLEKKLFDGTWNYQHREDTIKKLRESEYDLLVIGAGITGAGVAREGTMRGLKVAIIDMQDFAGGTSSRSSKLAHGGIRYLAHGDMDLVKEATHERNWMRVHIPHLIRPIPFLFVHLEGGKYKKRDIIGAVKIYDFLSDNDSEFKTYKKYQWYKPEEIIEMEPEYIREGNLGGAVYWDNNVDDARLTIETIKEAVIRGAEALNYCKVIKYTKQEEKIKGVTCKDLERNRQFNIKAKLVVNATGIWTDELVEKYPDEIPKPLIRPTKGVHLTFKKEHVKNNMATIIRSISDDRAFFVLPRDKKFTLIGTTDTDYKGDLANPYCNQEDAEYLIKSVKYYFPSAELDYEKILFAYAGIRPLVMQKGKSESEVSRKHIIFFSDDGLVTIAGGKLTEWRGMAEDLFEKIVEKGIFSGIEREKHFSRKMFLIGLERENWELKLKELPLNLETEVLDHLYQQYGKGAIEILKLIKDEPDLSEKIMEDNEFIKAELLYIIMNEPTPHLIDLLCRRTEMSLWISHKKAPEVAEIVSELMAKVYLWDPKKKSEEIAQYIDHIKKSMSFMQ